MKKSIANFVKDLMLYPVAVRYCSQSIYRTLWGCLHLWDFTQDTEWKKRAEKLCSILIKIQCLDGGFDNGYDYNFGRFHKKGEAIAPELTALLVLVEHYKRFQTLEAKTAASNAVNWIKRHAFEIAESQWAIPYGPYSSNDVIVYNGTSFAASALGVYLSQFPDEELKKIYDGMNCYLYNIMAEFPGQPGKFWYYSDQSRLDLTTFAKNKIDYYHQMQQTECHSFAELYLSSPFQKLLINESVKHVAYKQQYDGLIPYYNTAGDIHLWGYCSCANGFIMASKFDEIRASEYLERAKKVVDWMVKYSWNGEYFYPIITPEREVKDKRFYVRSDAWVFNTISLAIKEKVIGRSFIDICERHYQKMESVNFSGIENHATNARIRLTKKGLIYMKNFTRKWQK